MEVVAPQPPQYIIHQFLLIFIKMKYLILSLIILSCSCSKKEQIEDVTKFIFNEETNIDFKKDIECSFIPLETTDSCLCGSISAVKIVDDKIYIIDQESKRLLVFDTSGKFITQIGRRGNGPGEYMSVNNFHIDKEKQIITLADAYQAKIFHYSLKDYQYINTQKSPYFSDCCWLPDGNIAWVFCGGYNTGKRDMHYVKITDPQLNTITLLYPTDFTPEYMMIPHLIFYTFNQKCYLNLPFVPIIHEVTSDKLIPTYQLELGKHKFASSEWLKTNVKNNYYETISNSNYISGQHVKETENYICVEYYIEGMNQYIGFYNKKTGASFIQKGSDFAKHIGLNGFNQLKGTHEDYFIFSTLPSTFARFKNSSEDSKPIMGNIKEDDNPILCLVKFK